MLPQEIAALEQQLRQIEHFRKYPQMIPFIGTEYDKTSMLVLGESHYLPPKDSWRVPKWYEHSAKEWLSANFDPDKQEDWDKAENQWFGFTLTKKLVERAISPHSRGRTIYKRLHQELCRCGRPEFSNGLDACAYMNFFQRPAERSKDSIEPACEDARYALDVLIDVCKILKPVKIYFASSKSYEKFKWAVEQRNGNLQPGHPGYENTWRIPGWFNEALIGHGAHPNAEQYGKGSSPDFTKPLGQGIITWQKSLQCFANIAL